MAENEATLPVGERSARRRPPLSKVAPWLVIPYGRGKKNQAFYNLSEPDNRTCRKLIPELSGKSFLQKPSHQGWLIIICDNDKVNYTPDWIFGDSFLWNPATLETIQLPNILSPGYTYDDYKFIDCVLSSPPRTATTSSSTNLDDGNNSMVYILLERSDNEYDYVFLFCHPGDKQWRTQKFSRDSNIEEAHAISSLHHFKGDLYTMSMSKFCNYKIELEKIDGDLNLNIKLFETSDYTHVKCVGRSSCHTTRYVQTFDEFYRFKFEHTDHGGEVKEVISVSIARLDLCLMEWKEVNSLGDNVIFHGERTTACCSAAELGLPKGCLYYTLPKDQSLYKYELEGTGTIILPCLKLPTPWYPSEWIMMPTTIRVEDGQQITESKLYRRKEENCISDPEVLSTGSGNNIMDNYISITYDSGEVKQQWPWSILDEDTIHLFASYLHPFDYREFRAVCRANRSILPIIKQASTPNTVLSSTYVSPCLVYSITNDCTAYKIVNPMNNNENYFLKIPLLGGATIRFQKGGWLLMSERDRRLFFHNPFTKETIKLPYLPYKLSNISFSSLPTCPDCVVCGIKVTTSGNICVYLTARGKKSWKYRKFVSIYPEEHYMPLLNTAALHKGVLYCVDYNGLLGASNFEDDIFKWSFNVLEKPRALSNRECPSFLVECGGDLILVKLGRIGALVGVFKLDFSKMEWVRIKSLGKHMLFVSYTSCISRIAPNSGMENKIYFPRLSLHGEGILYYSLDTGSYHSLGSHHSSQDFYDSKGWSSWSWIEPNWSRSTAEELDWSMTLL